MSTRLFWIILAAIATLTAWGKLLDHNRRRLIAALRTFDRPEWKRLGSPNRKSPLNWRFPALQSYVRAQDYKSSSHPEIVQAGLRYRNVSTLFAFVVSIALIYCLAHFLPIPK